MSYSAKLREAIEIARDQFRFYESSHRMKGTPDGNVEAETNRQLAMKMQMVLDSEPIDMLQLETIQDYRFGNLVKGEHYAFARGLTINPTHLPAALDAMEADGYHLLAIFGNPNAQEIGFIFRMGGQPVDLVSIENTRLQKRVSELLQANNREVERRRKVERHLNDSVQAMRTFVDRVDAGEVRSKRTYAQFKAILDNIDAEWNAK